MVRRLIIASLLVCTTFCVNAQQNNDALEMHVTINGTQTAKMVVNGNETEIELKGTLVLPKNAFKLIEYKNKQLPGLEAVDLGLSVKWASKNFYQDPSESDIGELFTAPKDGDPVLNTWGKEFGHWRMPTYDEIAELIMSCKWTWDKDKQGYWVCNYDDIDKAESQQRRIFLPATGYYDSKLNKHYSGRSHYWTISKSEEFPDGFEYLWFDEKDQGTDYSKQSFLRAIRPVWSEEEIPVYSVDIKDLNVYKTGASFTVETTGGEIPAGTTCYYKWGDTNELKNITNPVSLESDTVAMKLNESLLAGKTYYFQAVLVLESGEIIESEVESKTIPATALELKSNPIKEDDITENTATVSMNFTGGYAYISSYGVLYTCNEKKKDALVKGTNDTDVLVATVNGKPSSPGVTIILNDLLPDTAYYYKSFACMKDELDSIRYSEGVDSFKTLEAEYLEPNDSFPRPPKAVDLGLPSGIKWSPWNMGASEPTDTGGYYGWGDVTGRIKEMREVYYAYGKQIGDIAMVDTIDIATYQWQGQWRMPQRKDFEELYKHCTFRLGKWENKGEEGWIVVNKSKTDSIFIPLAGYQNNNTLKFEGVGKTSDCYYWTSEANLENSGNPYRFTFLTDYSGHVDSKRRWELYPIRPVYGPVNTSTDSGTDPGTDPDPVIPSDGVPSLKIAGYDENHTTAIPEDGVDLGLPSGTKWAAWNVGAMEYGDVGHYYAWGDMDLEEKESCLSTNYNPSDKIRDNIVSTLEASDDIASRLWKGDWRMPTTNDLDELLESYNSGIYDQTINDYIYVQKYVNLQWTQDSLKDEKGNYLRDADGNVRTGQWGYKITSKVNGNSIFFPAGGKKMGNQVQGKETEGDYWTSTGSNSSSKGRTHAEQLFFTENQKPSTGSLERFLGCLVRPVKKPK